MERFIWKGHKDDVLIYVKEFYAYQQNKVKNTHLAGLLYPLPIPEQKWESVSMEFIMGIPMSEGKYIIYVVMEMLTKYSHFFAVTSTIYASEVVSLFFKEIFRQHGLPRIIISNRGSKFTSDFW